MMGMLAKEVKAMLVSDDEYTLQALGGVLAMYNMKCDMRLLKNAPTKTILQSSAAYDLIIIDSMDISPAGLDLLLSMRKLKQRKPVIIITNSRPGESDAELAQNHEVHLLRKPVDIKLLLQAISDITESHRAENLQDERLPSC